MSMVSAIKGTVLDLPGFCPIRHGGSFYQLCTEATPINSNFYKFTDNRYTDKVENRIST